MMKKNERREAKRISYVCEVECEGAGLRRLATRINDLSTTGAFIDSMMCYPAGTIIGMRFHINDVLIETKAEVRYSMPRMGMGVRFLELTPVHIAALESLIEGKPLVIPEPSEPDREDEREFGTWNIPDMLLGNFAIVGMFDVIQLIENNMLTGSLEVLSSTTCGEILFNDGQIVGADSGYRIGIEALKNFLEVATGSFEFKRSSTHYPRTIDAKSNMSLMLDLLRIKDEEAAFR